jgi:hypothetical protein
VAAVGGATLRGGDIVVPLMDVAATGMELTGNPTRCANRFPLIVCDGGLVFASIENNGGSFQARS